MRQRGNRERGAALVIALLVITIMAFLGGVLLLMSQSETKVSRSMREASSAFSAAEAGLETIFNQLPQTTSVSCGYLQAGCSELPFGVSFYSAAGKTLGQTTGQPITSLGPQTAPQGYNIETTQWNGYQIYSTGVSTSFLVFVNQMVELETQAVVGQTYRGTEYH